MPGDERQVRPLLPGGTSCLVIITSRLMLAGLNVTEHLILQTLSPADSVRLLGRLAGAERIARRAEGRGTGRQLLRALADRA